MEMVRVQEHLEGTINEVWRGWRDDKVISRRTCVGFIACVTVACRISQHTERELLFLLELENHTK